MTRPARPEDQARYAPAAVAQLTGISAHVLRAWERRYGAVTPWRTPGGARRYSEREVARLRLLRRVVDAGHAIGDVARLPDEQLAGLIGIETRSATTGAPAAALELPLESLLEDVRAMRVDRVERALSIQLATLGPRSFAREVASPLLQRIGDAWEQGTLSVAAEHAATTAIRNLLGATLRRDAALADGPTLVFATPAGERHELGAMIAALYALGAGARAVFLGADLPAAELADAALRLGARGVGVSVAGLAPEAADAELRALRRALPDDVPILLGGGGCGAVAPAPGVEVIQELEELEDHVSRIPC